MALFCLSVRLSPPGARHRVFPLGAHRPEEPVINHHLDAHQRVRLARLQRLLVRKGRPRRLLELLRVRRPGRVDAEHGLNAGTHVRDIAHVRAAVLLVPDARLLQRDHLLGRHAQPAQHVLAIPVRQRLVGHDVLVQRVPRHLDLTPGRRRRALEHGDHARLHHPQRLGVGRADAVRALRVVRDDVGRLAGLEDDGLDALAGAQVLAQTGEAVVRADDGVARVGALPRRGRRVRAAPAEEGAELPARFGRADGRAEVGHRVRHQARVGVAPGASLGHVVLAAACFLGGRADDEDAAGCVEVVEGGGGADGRGECAGCDEVVAAGVADLGEGVCMLSVSVSLDGEEILDTIFCIVGNGPAALANGELCFECRLDVVYTPLDCPALALEPASQQLESLELFIFRLGIVVDLPDD